MFANVNLPLLMVIVLAYIALVLYMGWYAARRTKTSADYMVAGREMNAFLMAMAYGSTFISTSAIIGFGGQAAANGMGLLWLTFFNIFVGIWISFVVFGKRTRALGQELDVRTFPDLLGRRYNSNFIHSYAGAVVAIMMPLYAAAVLIGGARFLEGVFQIPYWLAYLIVAVIVGWYVFYGGLKAVIYNDAVQGTLMLAGMTLFYILSYVKLGGFVEAHQTLTGMAHLVPEKLAQAGHQGWTRMPAFGSPNWWFVVSTLIMGVGIGILAMPTTLTRFFTVPRTRDINRALTVAGPFIFMMTGVAFSVGPLTNVWFYNTQGKIALEAAGGNVDKIIPLFIGTAMPAFLAYLFVLTMLAAAMSTFSGQVHVIGTALGYDLNKTVRTDEKKRFTWSRYGMVIGLAVSMVVGWCLPGSIIAVATAITFGFYAASFLPIYLAGLYWKRVSATAAKWSMIAGTMTYWFYMIFVNARHAGVFKLGPAIMGKPSLAGFPWNVIDPLTIALPVSAAALIILTLVTEPMKADHVEKVWKAFRSSNAAAA